MATLFPALGSLPRGITPGERRFAHRLAEKLEDDYLCWFNVPLGSRQQHPDSRRGLLVLEVKDWKREHIQRIDRSPQIDRIRWHLFPKILITQEPAFRSEPG